MSAESKDVKGRTEQRFRSSEAGLRMLHSQKKLTLAQWNQLSDQQRLIVHLSHEITRLDQEIDHFWLTRSSLSLFQQLGWMIRNRFFHKRKKYMRRYDRMFRDYERRIDSALHLQIGNRK